MTTNTLRNIARVAVGVAAAGMILGSTGTAFASEDSTAFTANPTVAAATGSWDTATAVLTDNQGTQTTVKARSFHYCSNVVGDDITLSDTQSVLFAKMARFDVVHADPALTGNGTADLAVTLLDGQQLTGTVSANCDFSGDNAAGRFNIYPDKLRSVEFRRGADAGPTTPAPAPAPGQSAQPLRLTGSLAGTLDTTEVSCDRLADSSWAWTAKGQVEGFPVEITFNTNHFRGAGDYNTTGITDEAGGLVTLSSGEVQVASNGDTAWQLHGGRRPALRVDRHRPGQRRLRPAGARQRLVELLLTGRSAPGRPAEMVAAVPISRIAARMTSSGAVQLSVAWCTAPMTVGPVAATA